MTNAALSELTLAVDPACWACRDRYIDGRLFSPPASFPLTWSGGTTQPERALITAFHDRGEHLHAEYPLGRYGHSCDILLPYRRLVVEFDGEWCHRVPTPALALTKDRRDVDSVQERSVDVVRLRAPEYLALGPTGAVDVYPPRYYRPDKDAGDRMLTAFIGYVLDGAELPGDWTVVKP